MNIFKPKAQKQFDPEPHPDPIYCRTDGCPLNEKELIAMDKEGTT